MGRKRLLARSSLSILLVNQRKERDCVQSRRCSASFTLCFHNAITDGEPGMRWLNKRLILTTGLWGKRRFTSGPNYFSSPQPWDTGNYCFTNSSPVFCDQGKSEWHGYIHAFSWYHFAFMATGKTAWHFESVWKKTFKRTWQLWIIMNTWSSSLPL